MVFFQTLSITEKYVNNKMKTERGLLTNGQSFIKRIIVIYIGNLLAAFFST